MRFTGITAALASGLVAGTAAVEKSSVETTKDPSMMAYALRDYTWGCGNNVNIKFEDCIELREILLELGEARIGWWTAKKKTCQSWKNGRCKVTFCPQVYPSDGLNIYMPDLAFKQFFFLGSMCATKGQRGMIVPANASYSLYVSEPEWRGDLEEV